MKAFQTLFLVVALCAGVFYSCQPDASKSAANQVIAPDTTQQPAAAAGSNQPDAMQTGETSGNNANDTDFGLLETESFGSLKLNLPDKEVLQLLGKPTHQSKPELWGADGLHHATWVYPQQGITLNMSTEDQKNFTVFSITLNKPSALRTARNVGIGSAYNEVLNAYKKEIDTEFTDTAYIIAGSMYGGLVFTFVNKEVSTIFLGAAAE